MHGYGCFSLTTSTSVALIVRLMMLSMCGVNLLSVCLSVCLSVEQKLMRQEDANEGELRDLKSQMSKVQSENRGMGSKLASQREQSMSSLHLCNIPQYRNYTHSS